MAKCGTQKNVAKKLWAVDDPLQQEVNKVASLVPSDTARYVTLAVAEVTINGETRLVAATSGEVGEGLHDDFAELLPDNVLQLPSSKVMLENRPSRFKNPHAEESIVAWANASGYEIAKIAASHQVCPEICQKIIPEGVNVVTPLRK